MLDSVTTKISRFSKKIKNFFCSCDPLKKFLQTLSPITPFLYSLVLAAFLRTHPQTENVHLYLCFLVGGFMIYAFVNSIYEILSPKKKFSTCRQFITNVFFLIGTLILSYFLFSTYLIPIFCNPLIFIDTIKGYLFDQNKTFFGKLAAGFKLFSILSTTCMIIYKAVMKYLDTPTHSEINIYKSQKTGTLTRKNDEYTRVDVVLSILTPLVAMIVNFMSVNDLSAYLFSIASILQAFHVSHNRKSEVLILPLFMSILSALIVCFRFLTCYCCPLVVIGCP